MGTSHPCGTPLSAMKLRRFSKVPEVIMPAKRHLNRTKSSKITRWSYMAYSNALASWVVFGHDNGVARPRGA